MKGFIGEYIEQLHREKSRHRKVSAWTSMLALLVVFSVVWGLRVKGISLTNDTDCGIEEHIHNDICYELVEKCGFGIDETDENGEVHVHTTDCYERRLACEKEEHVHTVACLDTSDYEELYDEEISTDELTKTDMLVEGLLEDEIQQELEELEVEEEIEELAEEVLEGELSLYAIAPDPSDSTNEEYYRELINRVVENRDVEPIHYGEFYVLTETGLRWADKINEWLEAANGSRTNIENNTPGVFYAETQPDGKTAYYLRNAGWPTGRAVPNGAGSNFRDDYNERRYLVYPDDELTLVVFRNQEQSTHEGGHYIFTMGSDGETGRVINSEVFNNIDDGVDGSSVIVSRINPGANAGDLGTFSFDKVTGDDDGDMANRYGERRYEFFYTRVLDRGLTYTHSDIEVTDGGFMNITTERDFKDGSYNIVTTHYDSYVADIAECVIHRRNGLSDIRYGSECYEKLSDDATQNEITSAFYCSPRGQYHYDAADVTDVDFKIALSLAPVYSIVEKYDKEGHSLGTERIEFADETGDYSYSVQWLDVKMNRHSVVDAINKCPNHSGMDFNLKYAEVDEYYVLPTIESLDFKKEVEGTGITPSDFKFQLLDANYNPARIIAEHVQAKEDGSIPFPEQAFALPGTYRYKIREEIDEDARKIEEGVYYKDYVKYDAREIDVKVEIKLMPDMVAVVNGYANHELVVETTYSINGEELDMSDPEDRAKIVFRNEAVEYKEKSMDVSKVWIGSADHSGDRITFRIIRTKNGTETDYYDVGGNTVFELNQDRGWHMHFEHLPVIVGRDTYTYEVQETEMTEYVPSYKKTETDDNITWTISNIKDEDRYLYIKKIWTDDRGEEIDAPSEAERVHIKLRRQYQEKEITLKVKVQSTTGGDYYSDRYLFKTYVGGKVEFQLRDKPGGPTVLLAADMSKSRDVSYTMGEDNTYIVDITGQEPELVLQYNPVTESDIILWNTGFSNGRSEREFVTGSGAGQWVSTGTPGGDGDLRQAYSTCYSAGEWNSERNEPGYGALAQKHRVENWAGARLNLSFGDNRIKAGEYYSFSARVGYKREYTQEERNVTPISQSPTELKLQLYSKDERGRDNWTDIASIEAGDPVNGQTNWNYLSELYFQIPEGNTNFFLVVNTVEEEGRDQYVDIYFDDIVIAPANYKIDGTSSTGVFTGERKFIINSSRTIPAGALEWQDDIENGGNIHSFTLEKSSDWMKEYKISDFGVSRGVAELPHRMYRYYVVEEFEDENVDGELHNPQNYKVFYEDTYVGYNTPETPMIVRNEYHAYVLPNTGGIGSNKIRWLGLLILLAGIPPALVNLARKRGRPSG